jgi:hypothetical protein
LVAKSPNIKGRDGVTRQEELIRQGWERQATYDEPRLSEMIDTYREIGLEVHLEPFDPDQESGCTECMAAVPEKFKTIYTRKSPVK